jgi:uncharacterized protein YcnI
MSKILLAATSAVAVLTLSCAASAHATLERTEAPADTYHKATLRVPHGCQGSPTLRVRVQIPSGVTSVKPQPKAGWELSIQKAKLETPVTIEGRTITEGVVEVAWSGRLLDEHLEEFGIMMKLPNAPGQTLYFNTVQECEKGVHRWIEVPAADQPGQRLKEPAPALKLLAKPERGA